MLTSIIMAGCGEPRALQKKIESNIRLYGRGEEAEIKKDSGTAAVYKYDKATEPVIKFEGTHPTLMKERILRKNWPFNPDPGLKYASVKDKLKRIIAKWTGWYPGEYKNYTLIK